MRIGILTLRLHTNYGGILQAYALQTVLERKGHQVVVLDIPYKFNVSIIKKLYLYPKRALHKLIYRDNTPIRWEEIENFYNLKTRKFTQPFVNKHIHRLEYTNLENLDKNDFDAIIVGADQIWRPKYFPNIENAFLKFAREWDIKRIAYAPSFGEDKWEYAEEQTNECKDLIKKFDAVSVREISGVTLCRKYLEHDAEWVLDPTMLLKVEDYIKFFEDTNTPQSSGTLLNYTLDTNNGMSRLIDEIAKFTNYIPFRINSRVEDTDAPMEQRIQPPVEKWLRGFYDAKFVVTDSFHACVFSILFRKQFVVVINKERGASRINSLLEYFGLKNRIVRDVSDMVGLSNIEYDAVYSKLDIMRLKSEAFLNKALC